MKFSSIMKGVACLAFSAAATLAQAQTYSNVFVFGDSLSDVGNLNSVQSQYPKRFSNGPVAVEDVASALGFTLTPSYHLLPPAVVMSKFGGFGNDYAVAGAIATDADGNPATPDINLPTQVNAFLQIHGGVAPSNALYIVMIGGNDVRAARSVVISGVNKPRQQAKMVVKKAVDSEEAEIRKLIASGAKNLLVVNVPDIGSIPETTELVQPAALAAATTRKASRIAKHLDKITSILTAKYDARLSKAINQIQRDNPTVTITKFDLFDFFGELLEDYDDYGYTNATDACFYLETTGQMNPSCNFNTFVFWDFIHPTAITHQRAANAILEELNEVH
jgi:phospholipase/lecithinase/hemolysin